MSQFKVEASPKSVELLLKERQYSAHNYTPVPIIFKSAKGAHVTDVDGNEYLDFCASYGATNTGHNHPEIVKAVKQQYDQLALPARAFTHDLFPLFCETVCKKFNYEKVLPLNGGAEVVEFAIKLCRSWGYVKKSIEPNEAKVMMMAKNYHGRTIGVISGSTNPDARKNYGPFIPNIGPEYTDTKGEKQVLAFDDLEGLDECFKSEGDKIAGVIIESVQGEAGIYIPKPGYYEGVRELCDKYNILWCADEIQMGSYRCGPKFWAYENVSNGSVRPDVLITAKSITGGLYPGSIVMSSSEIMDTIEPNSHGATFSGSPIACAATLAALKVYEEENLGDRVPALSKIMLDGLYALSSKYDLIEEVRGVGLIAGFDINLELLVPKGMNVWHMAMYLRAKGIACKMVHGKTLRWCPPLVIEKKEIEYALTALEDCCKELPSMDPAQIPDVEIFHFMAH